MIDEVDNFLAHYGKKGMKWGSRKSPVSSEHASARALKKKSAKSLTDSELKQVIGRMNLERQYKDLKAEPQTLNRATKTALSILAVGTAINSAIMFVGSPAGKAVVSGVKSALTKVK